MATNLNPVSVEATEIFNANVKRFEFSLYLILDDCRGFCEGSYWQRLVFLNDNDEQEERYFYA